MDQVYINHKGDAKKIAENLERLKKMTDQELENYYKNALGNGFFGVHAQNLLAIAMNKEFKRRFGESPITYKDGILVSKKNERLNNL
ncbi:hypothetical protein [Marixanthomonas ophiurae]|uniref:Uncharacterized protein n=1 Tax=Marixanthomonas ophiurae TaxID=387659 RepID=A0A3E1Q8J7_9FLAO|nr:hypothetical protein [Marixanthomonas ophiurae]RFN58450.1 hypothetical protein DZ858_14630 [Marixanthomonas ophiurae]